MMLKIQNGKCIIYTGARDLTSVRNVMYKGSQVFVNLFQGLKVGKYVKAYILDNGKPVAFGEIKFTVGIFTNNTFSCNYVLCEY